MMEIDGQRLLDGLRTLRTFGARGNGVVRPMFSDDDMAARRWLHERMTNAGLEATIDGVGGVHFCGAWWGHGFHEDGITSALRVCERLGVPWKAADL